MSSYLKLILVLLVCAGLCVNFINPTWALTDTQRYNSGYSHGCSDGRIGGHPYLNVNPTHTSSFMNGYNKGYSVCSGVPQSNDEGRINWLGICRMAQSFIKESCGTLTTPDGYTLTAEGNRVLRCFAAGAVGFIFLSPVEFATAKRLGPAVGCA